MKKILVILMLTVLLAGCSQTTFETLGEIPLQQVDAPAGKIRLTLPEDAAATVMEAEDSGTIYLCDGYTVTVQTLSGGDLDRTLRQITGFSKDALTVMQTQEGSHKRYDSVWAAAGESGDQIGRVCILDDGSFHYAVSVMADFTQAGDLAQTWQQILDSVSLDSTAA